MDTNDINERLQRAEERALAIEMACARILDRLLLLRDAAEPHGFDSPYEIAVEELAAHSLTAAREVMRKAEEWDKWRTLFVDHFKRPSPELDEVEPYYMLGFLEAEKRTRVTAEEQLRILRTERDELAALVEIVRNGLIQTFGRMTVWNDDIKAKVMPISDDKAISEIEIWLKLSRNGPAALADLNASIRSEVLEEAAQGFDEDGRYKIAAELRRMAGEGK